MWTGDHPDYLVASNPDTAFMLQPQSNFPMNSNFDIEYQVDAEAITVSIFNTCPSFGYYLTVIRPAEYEIYYSGDAFDNIPEPTRE